MFGEQALLGFGGSAARHPPAWGTAPAATAVTEAQVSAIPVASLWEAALPALLGALATRLCDGAGSLERGLNLAESMEARGFGRPGRTRTPKPPWTLREYASLAAAALLVAGGALWL